MDYKKVKKSEINQFLDNLIKDHDVVAPVRKDDIVVFNKINSDYEILLDYTNSVTSPKEVVIPQLETLLSYKKSIYKNS